MSLLFGWVPEDRDRPVEDVLGHMSAALRSRPEERASRWSEPGFGIGRLEGPLVDIDEATWAPAEQGTFKLWMAGEVFSDRGSSSEPRSRERLLDDILDGGIDVVRELDGEFWIALWDSRERVLRLANDRFGGLPLYFGGSTDGCAFAGGVRGVLVAPGTDASPDPEAIREAVTFGGFRLGARTNVDGVEMLPGGSVLTLTDGRLRKNRYWSFNDIEPVFERSRAELIEQADALWRDAIAARLRGTRRFGQTLSGGLDSRAILAEGAPRKQTWATFSYGVPGCDDVRFARRAAATANADWFFYDLYRDPAPDWLSSRSAHIHRTDGMIDLFDLMHVESVTAQAEHYDVHLSGYIGDAVCGPTFADVVTRDDVMYRLPYYGELAMPFAEARARVDALVDRLDGAPPRYALFENKLPQATNRWTAAWRPWTLVRKPFVDYALFDFWQGLPLSARLETNLYEHWLLDRYPEFFAAIPNQKTGVPILSPRWRHQLVRVVRFGWRTCAKKLGITPHSRHYHDVSNQWTSPENRARIEETILRTDSVSAELLGRDRLASFLNGWFDEGAGATQIVAALYVYEHYHRDLASHLRAARERSGP